MKQNNQKGFTLIELLVVIAIIGLLASVVLLALNGARAKARDAKRIADVRQIQSAQELYMNDHETYGTFAQLVTDQHFSTIPDAPNGGTCETGTETDYTLTGVGTTYTLLFCLEGQTAGYGAGTHQATPGGIQ